MTPDEIKSAIDALVERSTRTPTAFNWTPAMEAIWPRDMRPTMSGLLAIWEAMHEAAVYEGANADGWIPHKPGDPMPCDGDMRVDVRFEDGDVFSWDKASFWDAWKSNWSGMLSHGKNITHWRPAK